MELTQDQVKYMKYKIIVQKPYMTIEKLLKAEYPEAELIVIRAYNKTSDKTYNKAAYFNKEQAEKALAELQPNEDPNASEIYYILTGTATEVNKNKVVDKRTGKHLGFLDTIVIYSLLLERLKEIG